MINYKRITSVLIATGLTITMFVGCGSYKKMANSSKVGTTNNASKGMNATTGTDTSYNTNQQTNNPTATKMLYSNSLKPLITSGIITQNQSDIVISALTKNMVNATGTKGTSNNNGSATTTIISDLVKSGVINQTQANAINQKILYGMENNKKQTY